MIPFQLKDYYQLFNELIDYAQEHQIISTNLDFKALIRENKDIENFTVLLLSIIAKLYTEVYSDMSDVKDGYNILKAVGEDLDNLGALKGISRPQATSCNAEIQFALETPLKETTTIDYPLTVSTNDGIQYITVNESHTIEKDTTEFYLTAFAEYTGVNQRVSANTLNTLITKLPDTFGKVIVTNPYPATGGSETATDDEYREYLLNADLIHEKGTRWAYINYLERYEGLDSYKFVPQWDGTGTIKVIIDVADSTEYHIQKITSEIQECVAWADDDLTVMLAEHVPLKISLVVNVDIDRLIPYSSLEKDEIKARINRAVLVFVNGGRREDGSYYKGLCIGDDFIPHKLGVYLDNEISELKNVIITNPSNTVTVNDEEITYIVDSDVDILME